MSLAVDAGSSDHSTRRWILEREATAHVVVPSESMHFHSGVEMVVEIDHYFVAEIEVTKNRKLVLHLNLNLNLKIEGYSVETCQPEQEYYSAERQRGSLAEALPLELVPDHHHSKDQLFLKLSIGH